MNRGGADGCKFRIASCRIGAAMMHGVRNLNTRRKAVEDNASGFVLQRWQSVPDSPLSLPAFRKPWQSAFHATLAQSAQALLLTAIAQEPHWAQKSRSQLLIVQPGFCRFRFKQDRRGFCLYLGPHSGRTHGGKSLRLSAILYILGVSFQNAEGCNIVPGAPFSKSAASFSPNALKLSLVIANHHAGRRTELADACIDRPEQPLHHRIHRASKRPGQIQRPGYCCPSRQTPESAPDAARRHRK